MDAIEDAVPANRIDFIGESSLSLLAEPHVKRMKTVGFKAILPGIESWFSLGDKSRTGSRQGLEKVRQVSEQVNMILKYNNLWDLGDLLVVVDRDDVIGPQETGSLLLLHPHAGPNGGACGLRHEDR